MSLCFGPIRLLRILLMVVIAGTGFAQSNQPSKSADSIDSFDIKDGSYMLPLSLPKGKYYQQLSIYYVFVPSAWAHDNVNAPMFNYSGKYTLPSGFNVQGNVSTLFVSNRINLGPFWNHSFGDFHVALGYQVAFNFGVLKEFGFNTVLTGWEQQPSVTVGYSSKKTAFTLRADIYDPFVFNLSEGGSVLKFYNNGLNGYSITPTIEQRLWKDRVMSIGVKVNYIRYHILAWPAFPVNNYRYVVPEIQLGLRF